MKQYLMIQIQTMMMTMMIVQMIDLSMVRGMLLMELTVSSLFLWMTVIFMDLVE